MDLFRNNNNWLRYKTKSLIKEKHSDLFHSFWKSGYLKFKEFTFDRNRWWFVLTSVIIILVLAGLFNLDFLNLFNISIETAKIIVDQRTANIATIISITLVVVGFLISNIAIKEPIAYRLLFKHTYLYPIIYFTLSTIGCLFIISTLRDHIEPNRFIRLVFTGIFLAIVLLFLIGFLFNRIIHFTNYKLINQLLEDELMIEVTQKLKNNLFEKYNFELYKSEMIKNGIYEYSWLDPLNFSHNSLEEDKLSNNNKSEIKTKARRLVHDINLTKLNNFISLKKKYIEKIYYKDLILEKITKESDNFLIQKGRPNTKKEKHLLRKSLILRKQNNAEKNKESVMEYFDTKLEEFTNKNDYRNLKDLLETYYKLYELQINHKL